MGVDELSEEAGQWAHRERGMWTQQARKDRRKVGNSASQSGQVRYSFIVEQKIKTLQLNRSEVIDADRSYMFLVLFCLETNEQKKGFSV